MKPWYRLGDDSYGEPPPGGALLRHIFVVKSSCKVKGGLESPYAELMIYDDGVVVYCITDEEMEFISEDIFIGVHNVAEIKSSMDFVEMELLKYLEKNKKAIQGVQ